MMLLSGLRPVRACPPALICRKILFAVAGLRRVATEDKGANTLIGFQIKESTGRHE
jgi:hypothetical protein